MRFLRVDFEESSFQVFGCQHLEVLVDNFASEGGVSVEVDDHSLRLFGGVEESLLVGQLVVLTMAVLKRKIKILFNKGQTVGGGPFQKFLCSINQLQHIQHGTTAPRQKACHVFLQT